MGSDEVRRAIEEAAVSGATELSLRGHRLSEIPPELAQLTNLNTLNLSGSQLSEIPPELAQLTNLTTLNLDNNRLSEIPPELAQLTNLTQLTLHYNRLSEIPPELAQLTNLTQLSLTSNQLIEIPPELARLTNLTELSLNLCELSEIPPELGQLTNLIGLALFDNQLTAIPPELAQLTKLTRLYLHENHLRWLPAELSALEQLTDVSVSRNPRFESGVLTLGGNPFPPELIKAARKGIAAVWDHLADHQRHAAEAAARHETQRDGWTAETESPEALLASLEPVDQIDDATEQAELRREVEKLVGIADRIVADGLVDDELEEEKVRALAQALRVLVLYSDEVSPGFAVGSIYHLVGELARLVALLDPDQSPTDHEIVEVVTSHDRTDLDVPDELGDLIERRTGGLVTKREWLISVAAGGSVLFASSLVADVGLVNALGVGASSIGTVLLTLAAIAWRRTGKQT